MFFVIKLFAIIAILIPIIAIFRIDLAVGIALLFEALVPAYFDFSVIGIPLPFRFIYMLLFVVILIKGLVKGKKGIVITPLKPFVILMVLILVMIPFQHSTPMEVQITAWTRVMYAIVFLPLVIWSGIDYNGSFLFTIKFFFLIGIVLAGLYGLILTQTAGINPYLMAFGDYYENAFSYSYAVATGTGRPFGRIQSTFQHPMAWSLFLCLTFFIIFVFYLKERRKGYLVLLILIGINLMVSGVRTGLLTTGVIMILYVLSTRNSKVLIKSLLGIAALIIILSLASDLFFDYLTSAFQIFGKSEIKGSSASMRIDQLAGSFNEIEGVELVGKGYGWTRHYLSSVGSHPVILAFESLLFVIICDNGLIGVFIWLLFAIMFYFNHFNNFSPKNRSLLNLFVLIYFLFSSVTGEYDYMQFFVVYYTFLATYLRKHELNEKQTSKGDCILSASVSSHS